mmetsp:Transcript_143567/g.357775  ORF Transcript_143567/g.357775 Transcript_143567/m.357775 type:complete len:518 (-) Transcript_143567:78-1631(-)
MIDREALWVCVLLVWTLCFWSCAGATSDVPSVPVNVGSSGTGGDGGKAFLRGAASARGLALQSGGDTSTGTWLPLGEHMVADTEGGDLFTLPGELQLCMQVCSNYNGCKSFAWCDTVCYLKTGEVNASTPSHSNEFCTTYYHTTETVTTTPQPIHEEEEATCHSFHADMIMNQLQQYEGNPEPSMQGTVELTLCTNGTLLGTMLVQDGLSEVIATHIHQCEGGTSPQTRTAVLCSGPPVINFCGNNVLGLIDDGVKYSQFCSPYDANGASFTQDMEGMLVPRADGMTVADRVRDIAARPEMYYFNVHTVASYNHWYPHYAGVCRGRLVQSSAAATTTIAPSDSNANRCYSFYSHMTMNQLQQYDGNPDAHAYGVVGFTLCTNGTFTGTSLIFKGSSRIIATHLHRCHGGDTPQTRTADLCEGAPVINFCGDNSMGLIADGVDYPEECAPWSDIGASQTESMAGVAVPGQRRTVAELVTDIARNPQMYYFNVHTLASYNHWYPRRNGVCRGPVQFWAD